EPEPGEQQQPVERAIWIAKPFGRAPKRPQLVISQHAIARVTLPDQVAGIQPPTRISFQTIPIGAYGPIEKAADQRGMAKGLIPAVTIDGLANHAANVACGDFRYRSRTPPRNKRLAQIVLHHSSGAELQLIMDVGDKLVSNARKRGFPLSLCYVVRIDILLD